MAKTKKDLQDELKALKVEFPANAKTAELQTLLDTANQASNAGQADGAGAGELSEAEKAAKELEDQIKKDTAGPEGAKTGKTGVVTDGVRQVFEDKNGIKSITPTGKFESVGNLIFNEFGVHAGTEPNDSEAAKKASSFNTTRKLR